MEDLLQGKSFEAEIDEKIVFGQLNGSADAVWSLLLATGYLKVLKLETVDSDDDDRGGEGDVLYTLSLTNLEVKRMFRRMVNLSDTYKIRSNRESGYGALCVENSLPL